MKRWAVAIQSLRVGEAGFLVAPGGDQLVVVAQVGQGVIGAFEGGGKGLGRGDGRLAERQLRKRAAPARLVGAGGGSCADALGVYPFTQMLDPHFLWRNFLFGAAPGGGWQSLAESSSALESPSFECAAGSIFLRSGGGTVYYYKRFTLSGRFITYKEWWGTSAPTKLLPGALLLPVGRGYLGQLWPR